MTLVIDTGTSIVGVYSVEDNEYVPYEGSAIAKAIERILGANEVVVYGGITSDGFDYDLRQLGRFAGLSGELSIKGIYTDMRKICWSDRILGSDLSTTYFKHFPDCPHFEATYEGSNEQDTYMAFKLWELWKNNQLKIVDGMVV